MTKVPLSVREREFQWYLFVRSVVVEGDVFFDGMVEERVIRLPSAQQILRRPRARDLHQHVVLRPLVQRLLQQPSVSLPWVHRAEHDRILLKYNASFSNSSAIRNSFGEKKSKDRSDNVSIYNTLRRRNSWRSCRMWRSSHLSNWRSSSLKKSRFPFRKPCLCSGRHFPSVDISALSSTPRPNSPIKNPQFISALRRNFSRLSF